MIVFHGKISGFFAEGYRKAQVLLDSYVMSFKVYKHQGAEREGKACQVVRPLVLKEISLLIDYCFEVRDNFAASYMSLDAARRNSASPY